MIDGEQEDQQLSDDEVGTGAATEDGIVLLSNDVWGFESNCFVCEARNTSGLGIPFHHDTNAETVVAEFTLDERFSGAPRYVHGGVALAILDEAMAWATIAVARRFAVTAETTTQFERPVRIGLAHSVRARIERIEGRDIFTTAEIVRSDGHRCATAQARFSGLEVEQISDAIGEPVSGVALDYTSEAPAQR
ncbi:MAG: PaaI family thioesterase [Ilumatobacteraceae bacterium]